MEYQKWNQEQVWKWYKPWLLFLSGPVAFLGQFMYLCLLSVDFRKLPAKNHLDCGGALRSIMSAAAALQCAVYRRHLDASRGDFRYCNKDASLGFGLWLLRLSCSKAPRCVPRRLHSISVLQLRTKLGAVLSDFDDGSRTGWHFLEIHAIFNWEIGRRDARRRRCQIGRG